VRTGEVRAEFDRFRVGRFCLSPILANLKDRSQIEPARRVPRKNGQDFSQRTFRCIAAALGQPM
jgi:hypothetical protein